MNAYFVDAGDRKVIAEYIDWWPRYEVERVCGLVFAETPGKAKALFVKRYERDDVEFVALRCRLVARDVDRPAGVAADDDPLWEATDGL